MGFFRDFLTQKVPRADRGMPLYYRRAMVASEVLLAVYFPLNFILFYTVTRQWMIVPLLGFALVLLLLYVRKKISPRVNGLIMTAMVFGWCFWYVRQFGWGCGAQHLLLPLLILCFFNVFEKPWFKIVFFFLLIIYRMLLYSWSLSNAPLMALTQGQSIALQTVNSITLFLIMAFCCIFFSTSMQDTERQLRIDNQELHREAGTDPLTQLPNRRAMIDQMEQYRKDFPSQPFSVAMADIDFFKHINDTYGHQCGDYALKQLGELFRQKGEGRFQASRWGGEEFCIFLPGANIDEAGLLMNELNIAVERMPLEFDGESFSITITIGVEENDFSSSITELLEAADRKLYMGKNNGRNQVVV